MAARYHPILQPILPRLWLMTDERLGDALWRALDELPKGSGVIFRHYATPAADRRVMFDQVRRIAFKRGLMLVLAGTPRLALRWGADGAHGRQRGCITTPVHSLRDRYAAEGRGAQLLFLSPAFPTRTHPGARALGRVRLGLMMRGAHRPVIALGGMTARRARSLSPLGLYGWAAIDGLNPQ